MMLIVWMLLAVTLMALEGLTIVISGVQVNYTVKS